MLAAERFIRSKLAEAGSVCKLLTLPSNSGLLSDACLMRIWAELRNEGCFVLCSTPAFKSKLLERGNDMQEGSSLC